MFFAETYGDFIINSDVNYLSSTAPPAAAEWSSLLRPLRGREPEGMWNLLSIVREMFKRHDRNAVPLLEVLTEEIMSCEQVWSVDTLRQAELFYFIDRPLCPTDYVVVVQHQSGVA